MKKGDLEDAGSPRRGKWMWSSELQLLMLQPLFALVLLLILWTLAFAQIEHENGTAIEHARNDCLARLNAFSERVQRILNQVDQTASYVKLEVDEDNGHSRLSALLQPAGSLPTDIPISLAIVDSNGITLDRFGGYDLDMARQVEFTREVLKQDNDALQIGAMLPVPGEGGWRVPAGKRFEDENTHATRVLLLLFPPEVLTEDVVFGPLAGHGSLGLMRDDGQFVTRSVAGQQRYGGGLNRAEWSAPTPEHPLRVMTAVSPTDGVRRLYASKRLAHFNLVAAAGIDELSALEDVSRARAMYLSAATLASVLIIGFTAIIVGQTLRLQRGARAIRIAENAFRSAVEGGLDAFFVLRPLRHRALTQVDFVLVEANERAAQLFSMTRSELIGTMLQELRNGLDMSARIPTYLRCLNFGTVIEEEFTLQDHAGRAVWFRHQVVPVGDGVAVRLRNITAIKDEEISNRNDRNFLRSLIDHLPLMIYVRDVRHWDKRQTIMFNAAAEILTGYSATEILDARGGGGGSTDMLPDQVVALIDDFEQKMITNPMVYELDDIAVPRKDGVIRNMHVIAVPLFDDNQSIEFILVIADDVTRKRQQERELKTKQAELVAANDASPLGIFHLDAQGHCTYVNRTYELISGLARELAMGDGWSQAVHPEDRLKVFQDWHRCKLAGDNYQGIYRLLRGQHDIVWVSVRTAPVRIDGDIQGHVGTVEDITARRHAEHSLRQNEARMRTITDALPVMVAFVDRHERYRFNNIAYEHAYGIQRDAMRGMTVYEVLGSELYAKVKPYIDQALGGERVRFQLEFESEGQYHCSELTYIPQWDDDHLEVVGFHVTNTDITEQKLEERRLLQLAQIDSLTGFANRAGFKQRLTDALTRSYNHHSLMGLMFIDLDHFKPVNDQYGHPAGDQLLRLFAARLKQALRSSDTIARLGGDEFTVIMEDIVHVHDAESVASKIVQIMRAPFDLEGNAVSISVSIGLAFCRSGNMNADTLIKHSDQMLYQAKEAGRNTYRMTTDDLDAGDIARR